MDTTKEDCSLYLKTLIEDILLKNPSLGKEPRLIKDELIKLNSRLRTLSVFHDIFDEVIYPPALQMAK